MGWRMDYAVVIKGIESRKFPVWAESLHSRDIAKQCAEDFDREHNIGMLPDSVDVVLYFPSGEVQDFTVGRRPAIQYYIKEE